MLHKEPKHIDSTQFSGLLNLQLVVYWFIISENIQAHKEVGSVTQSTVYPRFNHLQHCLPLHSSSFPHSLVFHGITDIVVKYHNPPRLPHTITAP